MNTIRLNIVCLWLYTAS